MMNLKEMFQLSDRGAKDLKKGIFACTLTNLSLMLSVVITVQIFWEVLTPLTGGAVSCPWARSPNSAAMPAPLILSSCFAN